MPALFTSQSSGPCSRTSASASPNVSGSLTSRYTGQALPPSARIAAASALVFSWLRPARISAAPPRARRTAIAAPMPPPAPVTKATWGVPIRYGACVARARSWVPAMVPWRSVEDGFVTPEILDWYGRLADGRPGVLVVEATGIRDVPSGPLLRIGDERFVPGLRQLVEVVRERSGGETRLFVQIIDFLGIRRRQEKEKYLRRFLVLRDEHRARLGLAGGSDEDVRAA